MAGRLAKAYSNNTHSSSLGFGQERDELQLVFVKERASAYKLDIPAKFQLIEEMIEIVQRARRSYLENISKSKANH